MRSYLSLIIIFQIMTLSLSDRLVFLYTHFRHGARAPLNIDDNYADKLGENWTNPGELTGVGQRMHYLLGLRNRLRYIKNEKFISEKFDPHEVLIFTTDRNRTMVSVASQLQGLYPQKDEQGEKLTESQQKVALPQVYVNDTYIQEEITNLGDKALPYLMTLAPIRMVNDNERKMNVYDIEECTEERDQVKETNSKNIPELKEYIEKFNGQYGTAWNQYFDTHKGNYTYNEIHDICDSFLSDYADDREMKTFKEKTGLDFDELNDKCFDFFRIYYLYTYHGDDEKILAHVDSSKLMKELIFYIKRRLDADITSTNEDANYKDYSRPRMIMTSGHDSTVSADLILIIRALGLNETELYDFPKYATQLAIEVRTNKAVNTDGSYNDYNVVGYFDDKQIFNVNANDFLNKIENEVWSDSKVNEFCGFDDTTTNTNNGTSNNGSNSNSTNSNDDDSDNAKKAYKALMIVFICLTAILLATTIFLAYKLSKANAPRPPIDTNYQTNGNDTTQNNLK